MKNLKVFIVGGLTMIVIAFVAIVGMSLWSYATPKNIRDAIADFDLHLKQATAQFKSLPEVVFVENPDNDVSSKSEPDEEAESDNRNLDTASEANPAEVELSNKESKTSNNKPVKPSSSNKSKKPGFKDVDWESVINTSSQHMAILAEDVSEIEKAGQVVFERIADRNKTIKDQKIRVAEEKRLATVKQNFSKAVSRTRNRIKEIQVSLRRADDLRKVAENTKDLNTLSKSFQELAGISRDAKQTIIALSDFTKEIQNVSVLGS